MPSPHPTVDRDGRTFLAPQSSVPMVYPLPVDIQSLDGYDGIHWLLKDVIGGNYYGDVDVRHALAQDSSRRKRAVDFGCGTGAWVRDMAAEFPHVKFIGVDIVDSWDRIDDPDNIEFVVDDVRGRTRFADNTFDVVHIRQMRLTVSDFPALINEAARILCPGGLLLSGEWGRNSLLDNMQLSPRAYAPAITELSELLAVVLERNGPYALAEEIVPLIRATGHFTNDRYVVYPFYMGGCQLTPRDAEFGGAMGRQFITHFDNLRPLCRKFFSDEQLDELKVDVLEELRTKPGIMCSFYMVVARKAGGQLSGFRY